MEWIVVSVILATAYVYAPLLRVHASRRFGISLPAGAVAPESPEVIATPKPVELPDKVEAWCNGWYDTWAQEEYRQHARELFAQSGDWSVVLFELEKNANRTPASR